MLKYICFNLFAIICLNSGYTGIHIKSHNMLESEISGRMVPLDYILLRNFIVCINNWAGKKDWIITRWLIFSIDSRKLVNIWVAYVLWQTILNVILGSDYISPTVERMYYLFNFVF